VSRVLALARRELRSHFLSPSGSIVAALFLAMIGIVFFARSFQQGQPASMRSVFEWGTWMLMFICPALSMRAISEERRLGTFEMLMTSPISEAEVILGKFFAAVGFLVLLFVPTLAHVGLLELYGRPDYGELLCGYLGMALAGMAYLASGILASTLTTSQVVAFLATLFFWFGLSMGARLLPQYLHEPWATAAFAADPDPRLRDFAIGLIDSSNVIYFLSLTALFLMASVRSLEVRRWQ
jgi:ABC-2 type transport system permease protein